MRYVTLGKTGLQISAMGFGGIPIQRSDAEGAKAMVQAMLEKGVNFIDSARAYSVSEEYLGYALEGVRDRFVLATKSMARTREAMAKDIDISLRNFRTDYIDLYQIHNPSQEQLDQVIAEGGALEALMEAREAGKIGHIGITLHTVDLFERALELPWVETIMFPYNIVEIQGEECIHRCAEKNIGFICMKPFAGGALEDVRLAMRFIAANPDVTVVIPGMADLPELEQNAASMEENSPLTEEEQKAILETRARLGNDFCRRCGYCNPCSVGIDIRQVILFAGYLQRYDLAEWGRERYDSLPVKASACVECGVCETRCPYQLPIRKKLKKIVEDMGY